MAELGDDLFYSDYDMILLVNLTTYRVEISDWRENSFTGASAAIANSDPKALLRIYAPILLLLPHQVT